MNYHGPAGILGWLRIVSAAKRAEMEGGDACREHQKKKGI